MRSAALIGLLAVACAEDDDFECSLSERHGIYLVTFTEVAGTCGPLTTRLINLDMAPPGDGCMALVADQVSADQCGLARTIQCDEPGIGDGFFSQANAVTDQRDDDGDHITGKFTIGIFAPDGTQQCLSTYDIDAVRE